MKKQILCLLLAAVMLFSLTSCSDKGKENDPVTESAANGEESYFVTDDVGDRTETDETGNITDITNGTEDQPESRNEDETVVDTTGQKQDIDTDEKTPDVTTASGKNDKETDGKQNSTAKPSESTSCVHKYKLTSTKESTCTSAGSKTYTCTKCNHSYNEPVAPIAHDFSAATCTEPQTCKKCAKTSGNALGHSYGTDNKCSRCGVKNSVDDSNHGFTVSVKNDKSIPVKDVTVTIYTDVSADIPIASGKTNAKGIFNVDMEITRCCIVLSDLPVGYTAENSYNAVNTSRVNIKLKYVVIENPEDHSYADYKVGSTMWDFTVTDTDGNTYNLSELLKEQKIVILDFWYVSCTPCNEEFPYFEAAHEKYKDDVTILAMNHFDSETSIKQLRKQLGVTFPMVKEDLGFKDAFDISSYPTTVIINSSGKIVSIHRQPYESEDEFLGIIESLL